MEKSPSEIGVALITFNRPKYYRQVLESLPRNEFSTLIVVNDGTNSYAKKEDADIVISNDEQLGVAKSKNIAINALLENNKDIKHLFIIEDDILVKDPKVFQYYIKAAESTGIHHLCYEKVAGNEKTLKYTLEQPDGVKIGFYNNPQGAFMYVNVNIIKKLGMFDEGYINAFEHIDFEYNLSKKAVAPPFWYFPDLLNSEEYLTDIEGSSENSSITNKDKYQENWNKSARHFTQKWGHFTNTISDVGIHGLEGILMHLQNNYSKKKSINSGKKLSVIIPYRKREDALKSIIPALEAYLPKQVENYEILIIEQGNDKPFNKGLMNNIGFTKATGDYVCFHDVDLIPEYSDYSYPVRPAHISSHCSQFNYINIPDKIMGGVILFNKEDYLKVNGYSNEFNGWGKEDDDLYARCEIENLIPYKHPFGRFYSVPHEHRLTSAIENELHLKNGDRFRAFTEGRLEKNYHKKDGVSNCLEHIEEVSLKKETLNTLHFIVKC